MFVCSSGHLIVVLRRLGRFPGLVESDYCMKHGVETGI